MLVAIDGTSGSGESTIAKLVAARLDFSLLNTGLLYRMIAKYCIDYKINTENEIDVIKIANVIAYNTIHENLHTEIISEVVPIIVKHEKVRSIVRNWQKEIEKDKKYIVEGRDIGSVVFPNANIKFFINATLEERAQRRFNQINDGNINIE